ncbi:MAG TPA: hypothetical protein VF494_10745 [Candidatus Limnocylindrales bacterium]
MPPGHNKGGEPQARPCDGKGHNGGGGVVGGPFIVVPLGLVGSVLGWFRPAGAARRRRHWLRIGRHAR